MLRNYQWDSKLVNSLKSLWNFWRLFGTYLLKFNTFLPCVCVQLLSHIWLSVIPGTVDHQALLSIGFSRQKYWSRLPFPIPGDLTDPGIKLVSPASPILAGSFFTAEPPGNPIFLPYDSAVLLLGIYTWVSLFVGSMLSNLPTHYNLSVTPKSILLELLWWSMDVRRVAKLLSHWHAGSQWRSNAAMLWASCFSSHNCKQLSHSLPDAEIFTFSCIYWWSRCFKGSRAQC